MQNLCQTKILKLSEQAISSSSARGLINGLSVGKIKLSQDGRTDSVTHVGSQVASLGSDGKGNVTLRAGEQYTQTASSVLAVQGDIAITGKNVVINEAYDTGFAEEHSRSSKTATGIEVSSPLLSALQGIKSMADSAKNTGDSRMQSLAAINAGLSAKAAAESAQKLANGSPSSLGGIKITASIGSSKTESNSMQQTSTVVGSSVVAGGSVNIEATGAGKGSNLTAIATDIKGGNNVTLQADNQVNLIAAQSTLTEHSDNKSSGASIGIGFAFGGGQNGFTLEAAASKVRGNANGTDVVNVHTHVQAGNTVTIESGGDATLKGATVAGNTVKADIGGNLTIESLQDSSKFDSKQTSAGIGVSLCIPPFCYGTSTVSGSAGKSKVNADYLSVVEQSGIKAGDGGFDVTVNGNTDLKGAVIASTQTAIDNSKNQLVTASLTQSDLQNRDVYEAKGYSFSATVSGKLGDQSSEAAQSRMNDKDKAAAASPANPGAAAGVANVNGNQDSITRSGISGATITVTDENKQKELTGQDAATTIAKAQTGVTTDQNTAGALSKAWDSKKLQDELSAQIAITQAFSQLAPKAVGDYAQGKLEEAGRLRTQADKETDPAKSAALRQSASELENNWKEGGAARVALHTVVGALGGGGSGAAGAGAGATAVATSTIAEQISKLGASKEVKDALTMIAGTTVGAVAGGTTGAASGLTQITNNYLNHTELVALRDKLAGCKQRQCSDDERQRIIDHYTSVSAKNDAALAACTTRECVDSHVKAIDNAKSIEYAVLKGIDGTAGNELRGRQVRTEAISTQYKKVDAANKAGEELRQWARNHCDGISQQQCAAKLSEQKSFVAGLNADFTPVVGDIKSFHDATSPADYILATIGMAAGPVGDALGAVKKAVKTAETTDVGKSLVTATKQVEDAVQSTKKIVPVELTFNPNTRTWTTPAGLDYGPGSVHGNRVQHVLDHAEPNPTKTMHSVFSVDRKEILGIVDEAWLKKGNPLSNDLSSH